jgi:NTE family protein
VAFDRSLKRGGRDAASSRAASAGSESHAKPRRAVVLSGGGARGAYEAGVLRFLLDEFPQRTGLEPRFDIVCGTSVGAIHACYLAATAEGGAGRGQRLVDIWRDLKGEEVFHFTPSSLMSLPRRLLSVRRLADQLRAGQRPDRLFGLLDTEPLERLVLDAIPWQNIRRNLREGHIESVCIAATQIATGLAVVFVEQLAEDIPSWTSETNIRMQPIRLMPVHALASAAIPMLFPAVRVGSRYYADGGLRLNTPLAPAVRMGANRVLVIGLSHGVRPTVNEALAQQRTAGFGNPMYLFGKVLNALMLSPLDADLARLHFINEIIDNGEEAFGPDFLAKLNTAASRRETRGIQRIVDLTIRPSTDLGLLAGDLVSGARGEFELSTFHRLFMKAFSADPSAQEADLLSYLLFDHNFTEPLAELGHADALAREEELIAFFSDDE